jgi:hypothetical protein
MRYRIVSDDDGHEYVIPCAKVGRWLAWLGTEDAQDGGDPPEFAVRINGSLTFADPVIE